MCVEAVAHVLETNQIYSNRDSFMIQKTSLEITVRQDFVLFFFFLLEFFI